jgi:iron complex outermembrane recepter protein
MKQVFAMLLFVAGPALAVVNEPVAVAAADDFTSMDLEQLMAMEVTGVTRRAGSYAKSPAAIFVLTGEDIHRSGARTIADALRLVPGLQVVRTNAQSYTVTARGFGADKLQVLLDGRSVYTPLSSTVFWDVFDTNLEDIARIEVIRGPGATVWGANAVNGVINIITRPAADSTGTSVYAGGGDEERAFGGFRSGGAIGDSGHGRVYARGRERDASERADGREVADGQTQQQAGARIDTGLGALGSLSLTGDIYETHSYSATITPGVNDTTDASGRNVGAQWTLGWRDGSTTQTALYYDGYDRVIPTIFSESRDTIDLSIQQNFAAMGDHVVTLGTGVRVTSDETGGPPLIIVFEPADRTTRTYSAFLQDEWALTDSLWLIGGSKVEHNDYTGTEVQPGIRLGWNLSDAFFSWWSVSRALRTPNRIDHDIGLICPDPAVTPVAGCMTQGQVLGIGSKTFKSEELIAYEWGLRSQPAAGLIADLALFYNDYEKLRSTETGTRFANNLDAEGYGGELSVSWEVTKWLGAHAFYNYVKIDARKSEDSADAAGVRTLENGTPEQQAGLRLGWQPWAVLDVDTFVRYVDNVPAQNVHNYTEMDLRVGWHATPFLELSLAGQNLLDAVHPESGANATTRSEIARSVFAELNWRWK